MKMRAICSLIKRGNLIERFESKEVDLNLQATVDEAKEQLIKDQPKIEELLTQGFIFDNSSPRWTTHYLRYNGFGNISFNNPEDNDKFEISGSIINSK